MEQILLEQTSNATDDRTKEITHEDGTLAKGSVPAGLADLKQKVDTMAVSAGALVQPGIQRNVAPRKFECWLRLGCGF